MLFANVSWSEKYADVPSPAPAEATPIVQSAASVLRREMLSAAESSFVMVVRSLTRRRELLLTHTTIIFVMSRITGLTNQ